MAKCECGFNDNGTGDFAHVCEDAMRKMGFNPIHRQPILDTVTISKSRYEELCQNEKRLLWFLKNCSPLEYRDIIRHANRTGIGGLKTIDAFMMLAGDA